MDTRLHWAAAAALVTVPAIGQEEHYSRPPETISSSIHDAAGFALASDRELTVAVYLDEASQVVFATTNDGRALPADTAQPSGWTAVTPVSASTAVARSVQRDSIHVIGDQAIALWLDDGLGVGSTTVLCSRLVGGTWSTPIAAHPLLGDVEGFAAVAKPALGGGIAVHVAVTFAGSSSDLLFLSSSIDGGASFGNPIAVAANPVGQVTGLAIDSQLAEIYVAWVGNGSGRPETWFRRGLQGFLGSPFWLAAEANLSTNPVGTGSLGDPVVQVGGSNGWSGVQQRTVGVGWRRDDGDGTTSLRLALSADSGAVFGPSAAVAHTDAPGVVVSQFDLELITGEAAVVWQDNAATSTTGAIILPGGNNTQVWRAETTDGTTFPVVQQLSAQTVPTARGRRAQIARLVGAADGSMVVFLEETASGVEVHTAFADQANGTEWHDEYPQVSAAQGKGGAVTVSAAQVAYNALYYNFIVGWLQETAAGSGVFRLVVGGYRPPAVEVIGWYQGSTEFQFFIDHAPFQDAFGFVLLSFGADNARAGNGLLPGDPRKTGLIYDGLTLLGLESLALFVGPNDPQNEGVLTPVFPVPVPPVLPVGLPLCCVGVTWGPFGELHIATDWVCEELGPPPTNR